MSSGAFLLSRDNGIGLKCSNAPCNNNSGSRNPFTAEKKRESSTMEIDIKLQNMNIAVSVISYPRRARSPRKEQQ